MLKYPGDVLFDDSSDRMLKYTGDVLFDDSSDKGMLDDIISEILEKDFQFVLKSTNYGTGLELSVTGKAEDLKAFVEHWFGKETVSLLEEA